MCSCASHAEEMLSLLRETRATCLMVTHSPEEALRLGDRIAVMRDGRIVQIGRAEALYRDPADLFVARLFSEINEVPLTVTGGHLQRRSAHSPSPISWRVRRRPVRSSTRAAVLRRAGKPALPDACSQRASSAMPSPSMSL